GRRQGGLCPRAARRPPGGDGALAPRHPHGPAGTLQRRPGRLPRPGRAHSTATRKQGLATMLKQLLLSACGLLLSTSLLAADNPHVLLTTSYGDIELELNAEKAPISTQNFLGYVEAGFYNG